MLYSFQITYLVIELKAIYDSVVRCNLVHGTLIFSLPSVQKRSLFDDFVCWTRLISNWMNRLIGPDSKLDWTEWFLVSICLKTFSFWIIFSSPIRINYRCNILLNWVCHLAKIDLDFGIITLSSVRWSVNSPILPLLTLLFDLQT